MLDDYNGSGGKTSDKRDGSKPSRCDTDHQAVTTGNPISVDSGEEAISDSAAAGM